MMLSCFAAVLSSSHCIPHVPQDSKACDALLLLSHSCLTQSVLVTQAKAVAEQLKQFDIKKVYISPFYRYFLCICNMLVPAVLLWHH